MEGTLSSDQLQSQLDTICSTNSSPKFKQQVQALLQRYDVERLQITPENLELIVREAEQIFNGYCEQKGYDFLAVTEIQPKQVSDPYKFYYLIYAQAVEPEQKATVPLHISLRMREEQAIAIVGKGIKEGTHR